jgi:hypothetical protein
MQSEVGILRRCWSISDRDLKVDNLFRDPTNRISGEVSAAIWSRTGKRTKT